MFASICSFSHSLTISTLNKKLIKSSRRFYASSTTDKHLQLKIANPAVLLNHISHRYSSVSRVVMEFIDNSLDDAEELWHNNNGNYPYPINIFVDVDRKNKELKIIDNCRGLDDQQLQGLIENVGESTKKGVSWLNGQFGFGVHSFRAAASKLTVKTCSSKDGVTRTLSINRNQIEDIPYPSVVGNNQDSYGAEFTFSHFDPYSWREVIKEELVSEVERHFERLLARPNLCIKVREVVDGVIVRDHICSPFDYSKVNGKRITRQILLKGLKGKEHTVYIDLVVSPTDEASHKARFFALGRRVNEVSLIPSFLKHSAFKRSLWSHPQLIGYIDVGDTLDPVITRDEFKRSPTRQLIYDGLIKEVEPLIKSILDMEVDKQRATSFGKLENVIGTVLHKIEKEDLREIKREQRSRKQQLKQDIQYVQSITEDKLSEDNLEKFKTIIIEQKEEEPSVEEQAEEPLLERQDLQEESESFQQQNKIEVESEDIQTNIESKEIKKDDTETKVETEQKSQEPETQYKGFHVNFMSIPPNEFGHFVRSSVVGDIINVNTSHPDFISRLKTKHGRPKFTERLASYLAVVLSAHYHDQLYLKTGVEPSRSKIYEDLFHTMNRIETGIQKELPNLQKGISDTVLPENIEEESDSSDSSD